MSNVIEKVNSCLATKMEDFRRGNCTIEQCLTDMSVVIMSNMRLPEIENALYMSLGVEGVAGLIANSFQNQDIQQAAITKEDCK
jgi:hypothetical protein